MDLALPAGFAAGVDLGSGCRRASSSCVKWCHPKGSRRFASNSVGQREQSLRKGGRERESSGSPCGAGVGDAGGQARLCLGQVWARLSAHWPSREGWWPHLPRLVKDSDDMVRRVSIHTLRLLL